MEVATRVEYLVDEPLDGERLLADLCLVRLVLVHGEEHEDGEARNGGPRAFVHELLVARAV